MVIPSRPKFKKGENVEFRVCSEKVQRRKQAVVGRKTETQESGEKDGGKTVEQPSLDKS